MALSYADVLNIKDELSPMMQQYIAAKKQRPDCLLFFRLGDFYEMFFDDAILVAKELELTLTRRECGLEEKAPMAGVPHHSADRYIEQLVDKGYKVAICEQLEDPAEAKGIVKRDIVKVVTPGTVTDLESLDESKNNYLLALYQLGKAYGLAYIDLTSGEFEACEIISGDTKVKAYNEINRVDPAEILINEEAKGSELHKKLEHEAYYLDFLDSKVFEVKDKYKDYLPEESKSKTNLLETACSALLSYVEDTQLSIPDHIKQVNVYTIQEFMLMSADARANLELTETYREKKKKGSLLWVIDRTETAMGSRLLRKWLEQPLLDPLRIGRRLDAVEELRDSFILRQELKEILSGMYDIARLSGKLSMKQVNPRELQSLARTLAKIPYLLELAKNFKSNALQELSQALDPLEDLVATLEAALKEELPLTIQDGDIIKTGFDDVVDENRQLSEDGSSWILNYEQEQREKTNIKNLKVGYNKVFGYYIDVTKSNLDLVPDTYTRKQTLTNSERYFTPELKDMEDKILGAKQRLVDREYAVFIDLRKQAAAKVDVISKDAHILASLDALISLAEVAERNNYTRPEIVTDDSIKIKAGRHPVVEKTLDKGEFVANNCLLKEDSEVILLTGPNMSGKSTYMRQVAQIVILAQMGSFVPAAYAKIGITDQIFTRIGASDDLSSGQSTFMVEMNEVSYILKNATKHSLLILDEIGRGTSTYDGLSIAWAVLERVANQKILGARTLFATHYHELTELEKSIPNIKNYHVAVQKEDKKSDIKFLHKIERGPSDESYGIEVAKLAGLPRSLINRAYEILYKLESINHKKTKQDEVMEGQIDLFTSSLAMEGNDHIMDELTSLDVENMTAIEALQVLYDLSREAKTIRSEDE